ncbi:MAG: Asp-tRNA(Asn)/Glu-tRNA(Gln) amidotransferase subunit GatC [Acidimicrobiia bacterium]|nr:Asp-tRNA(Asn)/Glu-tRNA(Gln) amidotransferase subunit GatC [Acidimicrobiia bacterium]
MSISRADVVHVAKLARLELTEEEIEQFTGQLSDILDHAARIRELDTEDVAPTAHPLPLANVMREDEPGPTLDREAFLSQAPACEDGYVRVPRILDESGGGPGGGS